MFVNSSSEKLGLVGSQCLRKRKEVLGNMIGVDLVASSPLRLYMLSNVYYELH